MLLWQRELRKCWAASTTASPAGDDHSPPTPCWSGWDSVFSFSHHYTKNLCTGQKESGEGPQDGFEDREAAGKGERNGFIQP